MHAAVLVFHVLISLCLIGLILVQHGKGADAGAAFGSGASATVFGARGAASFLSKTTAILALCFFSTSFWLNHLSASTVEKPSLIQNAADTGSTDVVETTIEPIEDDKPATDDLPAVPEIIGDEDRPDIGPAPKPEGRSEAAKDGDGPPTVKSTSKAGEDGPAAPPDDKKPPPDREPVQPTAAPAPEKESEGSGQDAARPSVNDPVKGAAKPAPEPGAAPLEDSTTPADKPGDKAREKSR